LNLSGTSILAPVLAPTGGYAVNPQEYLPVVWTVMENASQVYTYSYTAENPVGSVLLNADGSLTQTSEVFDLFSVSFNTTVPGAYLPGSQTGSAFEEVNAVGLAWFFNPPIVAGSSAMVSFQSDYAPVVGYANAAGATLPSPWSSISAGGDEVPIPDAIVPEPGSGSMFTIAATLFVLAFRAVPRPGGKWGR